MKVFKHLLLIILLIACADSAFATTYYVTKSGSGTTCSIGSPCLTVAIGIGKLSGGDTLSVGDGVYVESIINTIPAGSMGTPTIIRATNLGTCGIPSGTCNFVLRPSGGNNVIRLNHNYVSFNGIDIDATNTTSSPLDNYNGSTGVTYLTVTHSRAHGGHGDISSSSGMSGGCSNCLITLNESDHNNTAPSNQDHGIYEVGDNNEISYNYIHDNSGYCLHLYPTASNNRIFGNRCYGTLARGSIIQGSGGNKYYNNLHYNNAQGLEVIGDSNFITNNTFYNNASAWGVNIVSGSSNTVQNNIIYGNGVDTVLNSGSGSTINHNIFANPDFNSTAVADFSLKSTSLALNVGVDYSGTYTTDIIGGSRPQCTVFDDGAYERAGCSGAPGITVISDAFDYANNANLNTQSGGANWNGSSWVNAGIGNITVQSGITGSCISGNAARSLSATGTVLYTRSFTALTGGSFTWCMKSSITNPDTGLGMYLTDSGNGRMYVKFDTDGNIKAFNYTGSTYVPLRTYTANTAYKITLAFDNAVMPDSYRVNVDGGPWSAWFKVNGGTLTSVDGFAIDDSAMLPHTFVFDTIGVPATGLHNVLRSGVVK